VDKDRAMTNLIPSYDTDEDIYGDRAARCELCGRAGRLWDKVVHPAGIIKVGGWVCIDGAWHVIEPRCKDRKVCKAHQEARATNDNQSA